jgi:hypothetical protein
VSGPEPKGTLVQREQGESCQSGIDSPATRRDVEHLGAQLRRQGETLERLLVLLEDEGGRPGGPEPPPEMLSENQAVERLRGMSKTTARHWLRREGLSSEVVPSGEGGRQRPVRLVYWPDVVERIRQRDSTDSVPGPTRRRKPQGSILGVVPGRLDTADTGRKR